MPIKTNSTCNSSRITLINKEVAVPLMRVLQHVHKPATECPTVMDWLTVMD